MAIINQRFLDVAEQVIPTGVQRGAILCELCQEIWEYPDVTKEVLENYADSQKGKSEYDLKSYEYFSDVTKNLYEILDQRVMNLSPEIKREFKKLYIAYKFETNFVDVVVQKARLRLTINMKFAEVLDPKRMCRDITNLGRWGNGDVEIQFEHPNQIDDIMELIEQSYNQQLAEN